MKKFVILISLLFTLQARSQSVFGYWYGTANVETKSSASNYLVELVLLPGKDHVTGIMNYYFRNSYRSIQVKGNYNPATRQLSLYDIPISYFGSLFNNDVDCIMNLQATLRVSQTGSDLVGSYVGLPAYKYTCLDINFRFHLRADISKKDSILKDISEFKEQYQLWKPRATDTLPPVDLFTRKLTDYVIQREFIEREIEVNEDVHVGADSLSIDFYDNGEIDGDSISVFYNNKLIATHQKLGTRAIHFDVALDTTRQINEISMFAENLGSIPPNTALMIIDDGKIRHEIRLSSTFKKNGTIRIRRKKQAKIN